MPDLYPFLRSLKIRTESQTLAPFEPNWAQRQILDVVHERMAESKPVRIICLKSRQLGVSTLAEALLFCWVVTNPNTNGVVAAHDRASAEHLFQMTKIYFDTWPHRDRVPTAYSTRRELSFRNLKSNLWVTTAERKDALRSRTIHAAHLSEVAFWTRPSEMMLAFKNAVPSLPGTIVILESTANGMGNWWERAWLEAEAGESDYTPVFLPWWAHPQRIPCFGQGCNDGSCQTCQDAVRKLGTLDAEERDLSKPYDRWCGVGKTKQAVDPPHLAWRRWAITNLCDGYIDRFHQEHPSTPEEAFITTGISAFPEAWLREVYEPTAGERGRLVKGNLPGQVKFEADPGGPLRVFVHPSADTQWGRYFVGADPAMGAYDGDYAAAQVMNRRNGEQVAVWEGRINPISFADELALLGTYYHSATISPEVEGGGYATVGRLTAIYPNIWSHRVPDRWPGREVSQTTIGFSSNYKRKIWAVSKLGESVQRGLVTIHDRRTYEQLRAFSYYGAHDYRSEDGSDDLVMSLAICVLCESTEPPPEPYEVAAAPSARIVMGERMDLRDLMDADVT